MKDPHTVILNQVISEKGTELAVINQYLFKVAPRANKIEIKKAVESIFDVNVLAVKVANRPGKSKRRGNQVGRTTGYRRAVVKLKAGDSISLT